MFAGTSGVCDAAKVKSNPQEVHFPNDEGALAVGVFIGVRRVPHTGQNSTGFPLYEVSGFVPAPMKSDLRGFPSKAFPSSPNALSGKLNLPQPRTQV
jgi:hypothetical protein